MNLHRMLVLVSLTVMAPVVVYTDARCPQCGRKIIALPGRAVPEVRAVARRASGRGAVVKCARCSTLCEVIQHAVA